MRLGGTRRGFFAGIVALLVLFMPLSAFGADAASKDKTLTPKLGPFDIGLIFNTGDILLDLDSYEAGLGVKLGVDDWAYRIGSDIMYNGTSTVFSSSATLGIEYHFLGNTQISPYIGGYAQAGFTMLPTSQMIFPMSAGAILGVEVFIFDFLSVFAEYAIAVDVTIMNDTTAAVTTFDYAIDTKMGNDSKLGVVVYFQKAGAKK